MFFSEFQFCKGMKSFILRFLKRPPVAKKVVKGALKLHSFSYQLAGMLSCVLEPDGLHPKHRLMRYHDWFRDRVQRDWDVLDVSCGNGALAFSVKPACRSIVAIDMNPENIAIAGRQFSREGISYVCGDATRYTFGMEFHAIILSNVLEHIEFRVAFLQELALRQTGLKPVFLIRVPMLTRDWITLYKREMGLEWRLDKTHFLEYTHEGFMKEMERAGLVVTEHLVQFGEMYAVARVRMG